jgi:hypothetical protein
MLYVSQLLDSLYHHLHQNQSSSICLAWFIEHNFIHHAKKLMDLRTSTLCPRKCGAEPGIETLEAASKYHPTNKDLLLCILRHLSDIDYYSVNSKTKGEMEEPFSNLKAIALQLIQSRGTDLFVLFVLFSVFRHVFKMFMEFDSLNKELWFLILNKSDLSFPQRRTWMIVFRHCFKKDFNLTMENDEDWEHQHFDDLSFGQIAQIMEWRKGNDCKSKNAHTSSSSTNQQENYDYTPLDVTSLEVQRDIERGRPEQEAIDAGLARIKDDSENRRSSKYYNDDISSNLFIPWGQTDILCPQSEDDRVSSLDKIRFFLQNKIFQSQTESDIFLHLNFVSTWLHSDEHFHSEEQLTQLQQEFPEYLTDERLGIGSLHHLNWLATLGNWKIVKQRLRDCTSNTLEYIFNSNPHSPEIQDFTLDVLYERPDFVDQYQSVSVGLHHTFSNNSPNPLLLLYYYSLGGSKYNSNFDECLGYICSSSHKEKYMTLNERWAMVQVLLFDFKKSLKRPILEWYQYLFCSKRPEQELFFWLEWCLKRPFHYSNCSSTVELSFKDYNHTLFEWFHQARFPAPSIENWMLNPCYQNKNQAEILQAICKVKELWPWSFQKQCRETDFVFYAIKKWNIELFHFFTITTNLSLHPSNLKQVLTILANYKMTHLVILEWVFTNYMNQIESLYKHARVQEYWSPDQLETFEEKSTLARSPPNKKLNESTLRIFEWVHNKCGFITDYVTKCTNAINARERNDKKMRDRYNQEQKHLREHPWDVNLDSFVYDYCDE